MHRSEDSFQCGDCEDKVEQEAVDRQERNILRVVASAGEDDLAGILDKIDKK